jgi:predicted O-methyltransferase YrrM
MNNITNQKVSDFIDQLYKPYSKDLGQLRDESELRKIPVITKDSEMLLESLIRISKASNILEIGTAIGYSAIFFASCGENIKVTSIEIRELSIEQARVNVEKYNLSDRITLINGDAADVLSDLTTEFDIIFIDAAKGQYKQFFDLCLKNTHKGSIIISDNILYKGITASEDFLTGRRNKTIMRRMREYIEYITNLDFAHTSILPVGDGIGITTIK